MLSSLLSRVRSPSILLFLIFNALDVGLSMIILTVGEGQELMPLAGWIFHYFGGWGLGVGKILLTIGTLIALSVWQKEHLLRLLNLAFGTICAFLLGNLVWMLSA